MQNDGMCAGLAEKAYGSLKDSNNGVFLGIGTGIGVAVFINGKLEDKVRGAGHMIIERNGRRCGCGKNGCYETYASMKVLKDKIRERLGNNTLSGKDIGNIMQDKAQMQKIEDIINEYIEYLAIGVSNMSKLCSADTIALGGSFVYYSDILLPKLKDELCRIVPKEERERAEIKIAELGNDAGIIGATLLP